MGSKVIIWVIAILLGAALVHFSWGIEEKQTFTKKTNPYIRCKPHFFILLSDTTTNQCTSDSPGREGEKFTCRKCIGIRSKIDGPQDKGSSALLFGTVLPLCLLGGAFILSQKVGS